MKNKIKPRVASGCECPRRRDLMHQPGCTKWGDLRPDEAAKPSPLPWQYPTETARPWRAVCMPSGAIYIKGKEGCRVAELRMPLEAMNANNAALLVLAVNSHGPLLDALQIIAAANPASTVMGLQQVALATLRAAGEAV